MPTNKYADALVNDRYQRLLAVVEAIKPVAFTLHPTADQYDEAAEMLADFAAAADDFILEQVREAASNTTTFISVNDRMTLISDALHDSSLLADLRDAAAELREAECEQALAGA